MKIGKLKSIWEEMIKVMALEPDEGESFPDIDKANAEELEELIRNASAYVDPETDKFSGETIQGLREIGLWLNQDEEEEQPEDENEVEEEMQEAEELTLEGEIKIAEKRKDLARIVKANDEFKAMRKEINKYPSKEALQGKMLKMLDGEKKEEKKEKSKAEKTPAKEKSEKKEKPEKKTSQTDFIRHAIKTKKSKKEIMTSLQKEFDKTEGWANNRMKLYEKAYGEMGKNDTKK